MDGVLVVDKPAGWTSHDVVSRIRRISKVRRVGHAGTLDPLATGVLPILIGKATKLSRYLMGHDKVYEVEMHLGITTDTLDAEGEVLEECVPALEQEELLGMLQPFRGKIKQVPPMYSARKVAGKKLYELARQGKVVEREAREVDIYELELLSFELPRSTLRVRCSSGTYIRTLVDDIGRALGCGAHVSALRRHEVGPFNLDQALELGRLEESGEPLEPLLIKLHDALEYLPKISLSEELAQMVTCGHQLRVVDVQNLILPQFARDDAILLKNTEGNALAVVRALMSVDDLQAGEELEQVLKTERVLA